MTKELMAECVEEAKEIYRGATELAHDGDYLFENHSEAIATIAVALYAERCALRREKFTPTGVHWNPVGTVNH